MRGSRERCILHHVSADIAVLGLYANRLGTALETLGRHSSDMLISAINMLGCGTHGQYMIYEKELGKKASTAC